jgi:cell division protein FtsQ
MAVPARKRTQPRQRYDVALNIPGAEVRLPSMPAIRFSWRVASSLLVILMALSLYILLYTPAFQVDVLEVEGLQRLTFDDINSALDISGEAIVKVDPGSLQAELQAVFPELSSVKVKVSLPAKVKVEIAERTPIISWVEKNGSGNTEEKWIDQEGIAFPPRGEAGNLIKVEADGTLGMDGLTQAAIEKSSTISEQAQALTPMLSADLIATLQAMGKNVPEGTPILFSTEHGFGWKDPGGWQVYFGKSLAEMSQKLLVYQKLVESLAEQGIEPSMISVEFLHAPFYRTEQ